MSNFVVKDPKNQSDVVGTAGDDRLIVTYTTNGGVLNTVSNGFDGASGIFFGPGGSSDDFSFSGVENITFDHTKGTGGDFVGTGAGNDVISTGVDDDTIQSGGGVDRIDGGAGVDLWGADLSGLAKGVTIDLADDVSTFLKTGSVRGVEGFRNFQGTQGGDNLAGTRLAASTIFGNGGDDRIAVYGAAGLNSVDGGDGADRLTVFYDTKADVTTEIYGAGSGSFRTGTDLKDAVVFSRMESFRIVTGSGDDRLVTGAGNDAIMSGDGNDTILSGAGVDVIEGGKGIDLWGADLGAQTTGVTIDLSKNVSTYLKTGSVSGVEGFSNFAGTQGADRLIGTKFASAGTIYGNGGDDVVAVFAGHGLCSVEGGDGYDRLVVTYATKDDVTIQLGGLGNGYIGTITGENAGTKDDVAFYAIEHFTVTTGTGDDSLTTGFGGDGIDRGSNDKVVSGDGNDTIYTGVGSDTVDGGKGVDLWGGNLINLSKGVDLDLHDKLSTYGGKSSIAGVEGFNSLVATNFNDTIVGTALAGSTVYGANGDDDVTVYMNAGNNSVDGGDGFDRLTIVLSGQVTQEGAGQGNGLYGTFTDGTHVTSYSAMQDFSLLYAGSDDVNLYGLDGADVVGTGSGDDTLSGQNGADTLRGGDGSDLIVGGQGVDVMTGGAGADTFVFSPNESFATPDGYDTIKDFTAGQDKIDLSTISGPLTETSYAEASIGGDKFADLLAKAGSLMSDGTKSVVFIAGASDGWLFFDTNGDLTTPDAAIRLQGLNALADFAVTDLV